MARVHSKTSATQRRDAAIRAMLDDGTLTVSGDGTVYVDGCQQDRMSGGYVSVDTPAGQMRAHRIVYIAVHGEIPRGLVINHLDGNKANNSPSNLEAVTQGGNVRHRHRIGEYRGFAPGELPDPEIVAKARALAERGNATRDEINALIGRVREWDQVDDTAHLMGARRRNVTL